MPLTDGDARLVFENAPAALLLVDGNGTAQAVNARFYRLAGLNAEEAAGAGWQRVLEPDDRARLATEIRAAAAGRPRSVEVRLGGVPARAELSPFAGGRVIASFSDDTARADAEQRLRQAEARQRAKRSSPSEESTAALPDAIPQLVWTADATGRVEYVNKAFTEHTGIEIAAARVEGLTDVIYPEDRKAVAGRWSRSLSTGAPFEAVYRVRGRGGGYRWFLGRAVGFEDKGRIVRWFGTLTDIDALETERARLHHLFADAPVAIVVRRGPEHVVELSNRTAIEILGAAATPGGGRGVLAERAPVQLDLCEQAYRTGARALQKEPTSSGDRSYDFVCDPIRVDGIVVGVVSFGFDVTVHTGARRRTEDLAEEMGKAVRARDDFLSIAGHELKTPIAALQLQVQGLQRILARGGTFDPDRFAERIDKVVAHGRRIERLVDALLDVSRISAGRLSMILEEVDLVALAREVVDRFGDELARVGSDLLLNAGAPVMGRWDRLRLDQILTNLISNAVKYGNGKPIELTVRALGSHAQIVVRDRGVGIDLKDQGRIFGRFERAFSGRSAGGLGLGLWITREFVQALGGTVGFTSELGKGTTFVVELPRGRP
jgi:PAS domain S-box-containing protein